MELSEYEMFEIDSNKRQEYKKTARIGEAGKESTKQSTQLIKLTLKHKLFMTTPCLSQWRWTHQEYNNECNVRRLYGFSVCFEWNSEN